MLGKLLKYEFKAIGRALLPFYGALIALAAILGIMFRVSDMNQSSGTVSTVIAVIMGILYVVLLCVVVVLTLILVIQRFSRNLLGNEGYLMLTLPTSVDAHIWNKTISATVWTALSGIIGMMTLPVILFTSGAGKTNVGEVFRAIGTGIGTVADKIGGGNLALIIVEAIVMMILISAAFVLQIYASISIGHQANNHKGLLSVVTFIGLAIAQSVIESILGVNGVFNFHISNSGEIANGVSMAQEGMLVTILTAVAFGTIYYIITRLLMKYKLNLE